MPLTIHFLSKERTCAKKGNKKGDEENERSLCLNPFASKSLYGKFASQKEPSAKRGSFAIKKGRDTKIKKIRR